MKKVLLASVLSIFLGASVLFSGCGCTDLSEINKQIADLQQQITESNKIIDNLQSQIADSNQTIDNLESQIADSNQTIDNLQSQIADSNQTIDNLENQIADSNQTSENLKSQITSLNQTILELQTRLNQAEQNQQELLLDLTTAQGQLLELQEQVFGQSDNYKSIGETLSYVVDGFKMFELTFTDCTYDLTTTYHSVSYEFISNIPGINDITSEELNMTFIFYDNVNSISYTVLRVTSNYKIIFSLDIPNELRSGEVFIYLGNSLLSVYKVNFAELSS